MSIPRTAIRRPITVFMISAVIVLLGAISLTRLPVDLMPDISFPSLTVRVNYPGVGPLEIEELITRPLEEAVSAVAGLQQVNSTSSEGTGTVRLNFAWGTDLNEATDEVRSRLDRIRGRFPEEADAPFIFKFDANSLPILSVGVEGMQDPVQLREVAERELVPRLERVTGVAAVQVHGGLRRQIHVELSKEKIAGLQLPVERVVQLLRIENKNLPLGEIDQGDRTYLLRSEGQFQSFEDIRNLVVLTKGGVPVYMRDIAEVRDATEDRRSILRINGRPGVRLQVTKQSGTNTVQVAQLVHREVEKINNEIPGVNLTILDDSSVFIQRAIASVQEHALMGSVLVVLIIFVFLRNLTSTLIICSSIPISVIGTFALLYFGGFTLNTMTFGGLALGVGMIVDASIVVLENSFRHMEKGKDRVTAAIEGSEEVWSAIVASILTHVAVFLPLLFLTGLSSILFMQLAVVVIFSLMMSLFVAVTIVPMLCSKLLRLPPRRGEARGLFARLYAASEDSLERLDDRYRWLLHKALAHRPTVLLAGLTSVVAAVLMFSSISSELTPQLDEGEVTLTAELPVGTRMERTDQVLWRLEELVRRFVPESRLLISSVGGMGWQGSNTHRGTLQIRLVPKEERQRSSEQIARDLRRQLAELPGVVIFTRASGGNQMTRWLTAGNEARLTLELRGDDLDTSRRLAQEIKGLMDSTSGIADSRVSREDGLPELAVQVDRPKAALLGLTVSSVADTIKTNVAGTQAAYYREHGEEYPIVVRLREEDRDQADDVSDILVNTPRGELMAVRNLMSIEMQSGPVQIQRKNKERIIEITAEPESALSQAVSDVRSRLSDVALPLGFTVGFGAEVEEQARAFNQLRLMLILALVLVYAVMASQYESLRDPFVIMFSVPTAAIGVVLALLLTNTAFNLQAYIGVIMLAGIVVSNAILLVDYTNVLRRRDGVPLREAVELAGRTRLRPILMTSVATALGFVPMSLGIGEGSELQAPLARVVIGGLTTSTLITLVFVPTIYTLFEEGWRGLRRRKMSGSANHPDQDSTTRDE